MINNEKLWKPIDSIPKDGTYVLLYAKRINRIYVGFYNGTYKPYIFNNDTKPDIRPVLNEFDMANIGEYPVPSHWIELNIDEPGFGDNIYYKELT